MRRKEELKDTRTCDKRVLLRVSWKTHCLAERNSSIAVSENPNSVYELRSPPADQRRTAMLKNQTRPKMMKPDYELTLHHC